MKAIDHIKSWLEEGATIRKNKSDRQIIIEDVDGEARIENLHVKFKKKKTRKVKRTGIL